MTQDELNAALAASPSPDRVTPEYLKSRIHSVGYIERDAIPSEHPEAPTLTICVVTLDNGFTVTGESACADPANYKQAIGRKIAYDMAERQIWPLLGFALKEAMTARDAAPNLDALPGTVEYAAMMAHEANRAYCASLGDTSQVSWSEAPENIKASAIDGVRFIAENPDAAPSASHENWYRFKLADGWRHGWTKDPERKTHPCMVPYDQLPQEQRSKDYLFRGIVKAALRLA